MQRFIAFFLGWCGILTRLYQDVWSLRKQLELQTASDSGHDTNSLVNLYVHRTSRPNTEAGTHSGYRLCVCLVCHRLFQITYLHKYTLLLRKTLLNGNVIFLLLTNEISIRFVSRCFFLQLKTHTWYIDIHIHGYVCGCLSGAVLTHSPLTAATRVRYEK